MLLSEQYKVIGLGTSTDFNAGFTADSINTKNLKHIMYVLTFGAITGAGPFVVTVKSGASAGTQTTAETIYYRYGSAAQAAATADVYTGGATDTAAWASGTSASLAVATLTTRCLIVEFDVDTITAAQPWVTLAIDAGADSGVVHAVAVCVERYQQRSIPTAI